MNVRLAQHRAKPQRGGFTLIELLVVISIIGVLASLILPGVQNARATARRMQCLNNMRNVGVAIQNYATNNNGQLPPLAKEEGTAENASATPAVPETRRAVPWSVYLLPYLDQAGLYDIILDNDQGGPLALNNAAPNPRHINIPVYTCADDPRSAANGTLSFVANGGWYLGTTVPTTINADTAHGVVTTANLSSYVSNWALPAAASVVDARRSVAATGTTFRDGIRMTQDQIKDGSSQTLLLSENIQAGNWYDVTTGHIAFVAPVTRTANNGNDDDFTDIPAASRINDSFATALSGQAPRPSSYHTQVVNVIFADGSGRNLSQSINHEVYRKLITSSGMAAFQELPLSGNSF